MHFGRGVPSKDRVSTQRPPAVAGGRCCDPEHPLTMGRRACPVGPSLRCRTRLAQGLSHPKGGISRRRNSPSVMCGVPADEGSNVLCRWWGLSCRTSDATPAGGLWRALSCPERDLMPGRISHGGRWLDGASLAPPPFPESLAGASGAAPPMPPPCVGASSRAGRRFGLHFPGPQPCRWCHQWPRSGAYADPEWGCRVLPGRGPDLVASPRASGHR